MKTKRPKWEMLMREQRHLKSEGIANLHRRITLLVECYDDPEYRAWCEANGTSDLDALDAELADAAVDFMTARAVLEQFPKIEEWQKHGIRELIALVMEADASRRKVDGEARVSWKQRALEAERECERLRSEIKTLRDSLGLVAGAKCA